MTADEPSHNTSFATIEQLLSASMAAAPIAISHEGKENQVKVWEFADEKFGNFLIRQTGLASALATTTHLTPVDYIFHGPNIGQPLMLDSKATITHQVDEGKTGITNVGSPMSSYISIMQKQKGDPIRSLYDANRCGEIVANITENPESLENLFRTVALAAVSNITTSNIEVDLPNRAYDETLDLNAGNILWSKNTGLGLIDQMHFEGRFTLDERIALEKQIGKTHEDGTTRYQPPLNFAKALNSLTLLSSTLLTVFEAGGADEALQNKRSQLRQTMQAILTEAEKQTTPYDQLVYLQQYLSPEGKFWSGVEPVVTPETSDEKLKNPPFGGVTHVEATSLNIRKASPNQLLRNLNEMHGACVTTSL